jgi:chromosome segregation ATPase
MGQKRSNLALSLDMLCVALLRARASHESTQQRLHDTQIQVRKLQQQLHDLQQQLSILYNQPSGLA